MYSLTTLRKRAYAAGYRIEKGFQHYTVTGAIFTNYCGDRFSGYMVKDFSTGIYEWGSYDEHFTHLWTLEDVEEFLKQVYEKSGLTW